MQNTINKALKYLEEGEYASYFEIIEQIIPSHLRASHQANKMKYISGHAPWNFNQQLEVFTKEVARVVHQNANDPLPPLNLQIQKLNAIKAMLLEDRLKDALYALYPLSEEINDGKYASEVILATANFHGNERSHKRGSITDQLYLSQRVRLRMNIIYILEQMKDALENPDPF